MSTVAEQLRHARQAQNLTIHQVAEITKIRTDHLRALEDGNFSTFSAPVYIRGFIRCYATLLKLDVPQVMSALDAEIGQTAKFREPTSLSDPGRGPVDFLMYWLSQVNWKKSLPVLIAIVVILLAVLAIQSWRNSKPASSGNGVKPGMYQPGPSGDTLPVPSTPQRKP